MSDERTDLYRVVAQILLWIEGLTNIKYQIYRARITKVEHEDEIFFSFDVVTNTIRPGRLSHPLALVMDSIHIALTGTLVDLPEGIDFTDNDIVEIEIDDMPNLFLKADHGGYNNIAVQTKVGLFTGGSEVMTRHFIFKNNMMYQIR